MHSKELPDQVDVIIVLGAQVRPDGEPSEALRRRLTLALACFERRQVPVICCGAQGRLEPMAEGDFMRTWLIEHGAPERLVFSENRSYDTMENIRNAKGIMDLHGFSVPLVVTSDYHVRRSLAICRRNGLDAVGVGSSSARRYWIKNHARECLAWIKFWLRL